MFFISANPVSSSAVEHVITKDNANVNGDNYIVTGDSAIITGYSLFFGNPALSGI